MKAICFAFLAAYAAFLITESHAAQKKKKSEPPPIFLGDKQLRRPVKEPAKPTPAKPFAPPPSSRPKIGPQNLLKEATAHSTAVVPLPFRPEQASYVSVGPGLVFYEGKYAKQAGSKVMGMSANIGYVKQWWPGVPVYIGADLALNFWNLDRYSDSLKLGILGIQLLPTAIYRFASFSRSIHAYFGISAGPHLHLAQFTSTKNASYFSELTVYFELLMRPGLTVAFAPDFALNFEPKFGVLRTETVFLPQMTANLSL